MGWLGLVVTGIKLIEKEWSEQDYQMGVIEFVSARPLCARTESLCFEIHKVMSSFDVGEKETCEVTKDGHYL